MRTIFRRLGVVVLCLVVFGAVAYYNGFDFGSLRFGQGQRAQSEPVPLPLVYINRELPDPDCKSRCNTLEVHSLEVEHAPALSQAIERRLVQLAFAVDDVLKPKPIDGTSIGAYARSFFAAASAAGADSSQGQDQSPGANPAGGASGAYRSRLGATAISHRDRLIALRLQATLSQNGAPLATRFAYVTVDAVSKRLATLDDMLRPGKRDAFNAVVKAAFASWQQSHDVPGTHKFQPSDNIALLRNNALIAFPSGTLKPAALGESELEIPYDALDAVLQPRFLPGGDPQS